MSQGFPIKRVFVAEFVCGGGMSDTPTVQIPLPLLCEGELMWRALLDDISQWADITTPIDPRLSLQSDEVQATCVTIDLQKPIWSQWIAAAQGCHHVVIVAPETDFLLIQGISAFRSAGFQVMAVNNAALRIASDKWQTAKWLHREAIPHPETWGWDASGHNVVHSVPLAHSSASSSLSFSTSDRFWVKPRDGCGSMGVRCFQKFEEAMDSMLPHEITQRHANGQSGSILAVGNGIDHCYALMPAVWQNMKPAGHSTLGDRVNPPTHFKNKEVEDRENEWSYQGGCGPVANEIQRRAEILAERVIETLPGKLSGFVGIDWIAADDPSLDCVIEVNPRLTTSYIGIRQAIHENLTRRLLQCPDGRSGSLDRPAVSVPAESIHWTINRSLQNRRNHLDHHRLQ